MSIPAEKAQLTFYEAEEEERAAGQKEGEREKTGGTNDRG